MEWHLANKISPEHATDPSHNPNQIVEYRYKKGIRRTKEK
jgi:hypothetical protein